jgi:hypothetical protein
VVDDAMEADAPRAMAEFGGEFRSDLEAYISREVVEACVSRGVRERPRVPGVSYRGFVDPAGGSGQDAMTMAIGHVEGDRAIVDAVRRVTPPFSPSTVIADFAAMLKTFGVARVTGDRFGGEFRREIFRQNGVSYHLAEKTRSQFYVDLVPALNSRKVDLVDEPRSSTSSWRWSAGPGAALT